MGLYRVVHTGSKNKIKVILFFKMKKLNYMDKKINLPSFMIVI